jgi:hypothetical protein
MNPSAARNEQKQAALMKSNDWVTAHAAASIGVPLLLF